MIGIRTDETGQERCSHAYLTKVQILADDVERRTMAGDAEWDLAQYAQTIIQEVYRLRSRVAYLEGWKEGVEPFVAKHRPRPPVYRAGGMI